MTRKDSDFDMKKRGQMSEAVSTGIVLTLSGGFQDAYTYYCRGKVFANAQTGNIILLGHYGMSGDFAGVFRYCMPVLAFAGGIYAAEIVRGIYKEYEKLHWRQIIVILEIILLFITGFLPQSLNMAANILVSFVCAMQVETFRKMKGSAFASTMCIGNLRSATELLYHYRHTGDRQQLKKCLQYYGVIAVFAVGAAVGSLMSFLLAERTIWISCLLLIAAFFIMFIKEDLEV